ncbi:MAG: hypothetical protein ACFBSE_14025 [Prochloraceae cyanobacterium]
MSIIHWNRSVLTFHLKEIVEDGQKSGDRLALIGLGAIALGTIALPAVSKLGRPLLKAIVKNGILLYEEAICEEIPNQQPATKNKQDLETISQNNGKI